MLITLFAIILALVAGYAFVAGGRDERYTAAVFLCGYLGSIVVTAFSRNNYLTIQWQTWAVDALMLLPLLWIALRSSAEWPDWMVAMQLLGVAGHAARIIHPEVMNWIYFTLTALWAIPMLILLAWATRRQQLRRRDRSVRPLSPSSWTRSFFQGLRM